MLIYRVLRNGRLEAALMLSLMSGLFLSVQSAAAASIEEKNCMSLKLELISFEPGKESLEALKKPLGIVMNRLLTPDEELESPLNNAREVAAMRRRKNVSQEKSLEDAISVLAEHFNKKSSQLTLVGAGKGHKPERGEDLEKNWVFSLVMPTLSDHIYWVIVPKDAPEGAYVYGFN
jgi:hypothetical protein